MAAMNMKELQYIFDAIPAKVREQLKSTRDVELAERAYEAVPSEFVEEYEYEIEPYVDVDAPHYF